MAGLAADFQKLDFICRGSLQQIERSETEVKLASMLKEEQARAEKLHAILVELLRNRPLKLLRAVEGRNGYEVWRQLSLS